MLMTLLELFSFLSPLVRLVQSHSKDTLDFTMAGKMSTIRKVLLLYSPSRAAGWVPHTLFYLVGLVLIATVGNSSVLRIQNLSSRLIFELMLVCLLVSVWGWASEKTGLSRANK
jgi:hypothetical protein